MSGKKNANQRYIKSAEKYKLWIDTKNQCAKCNAQLTFISDDEYPPKNTRITKQNIKDSHWGEIAHIVSHGDLKYKKMLLRSRKEKHEILEQKNIPFVRVYKNEFVNGYKNLIILCRACHAKIDGRGYLEPKDMEFLTKTSNEQIKELLDLKSKHMQSYGEHYYQQAKNYPPITFSSVEEFKSGVDLLIIIIKKLSFKSYEMSVDSSTLSEQSDSQIFNIIVHLAKDENCQKRIENFRDDKNLKLFFETKK